MAWTPPVNIPSLGGKNYAGELYGMISGVGEAYYGAKRDKIGDQQWQAEQDRMSAAQALAQSNADRNYALELQKFEADQAAGPEGPTYYGSPQWYNRPDGSMGFGVLGNDGSFKDMPAPEGAQWAPPVTFQDTGTAKVPMYSRGGGQAGAPLPIDNAGQQRQQEIGTAGGKAAAALPMIEYQTQILLGGIDAVVNDPNLPFVTGPVGGMVPTWMSTDPGAMYATQARVNQVIGKSFLQAYDALRGAGAITEQEGQAAKEAWTRLTTQQMSDAEYLQALMDYRREAAAMLEIARQRATGGLPAAQSQGVPLTTPGGVTFQKMGQ